MSLESLSTKLYLVIAAAALAMWIAGVPGRTILSLGAVGFVIAMHAGGHGGREDRDDGPFHAGHTGPAPSASSPDAPVADSTKGTRPPGSGSGGCH